MARILKTVRAELDLDEIWLFIATDNVGAADALIDTIGQTACRLAEQPLMGRARPELAPEIRSFPVGRYVLFYRPVPTPLGCFGCIPRPWRGCWRGQGRSLNQIFALSLYGRSTTRREKATSNVGTGNRTTGHKPQATSHKPQASKRLLPPRPIQTSNGSTN